MSSEHNHHHNHELCKQSASATLDLIIFVLVMFSSIFLMNSYLTYILKLLSLCTFPFSISINIKIPSYSTSWSVIGFVGLTYLIYRCCFRSRWRKGKCRRMDCQGLKLSKEKMYDVKLFKEEDCFVVNKEFEKIPWKGGSEKSPFYEVMRAELRRMAPINGKALLIFRRRCGCAVSKLEGWGVRCPTDRRNKKKFMRSVTSKAKQEAVAVSA